MEFVPFHLHTGYSYGDGFGHPRMHVKRLKELGIKAMFVSEHGTVTSHVQIEILCKEAGIKPGFGCEIYYVPQGKQRSKFHLGVYAMNEEGYRNLNKIITQSYIDSYQFPTVHWEVLEKYNAGLAILSGCSDSLLSCTLLGGKSLGEKRDEFTETDYANFRREAEKFQEIFEDRFFLEVQRFPGLPRTCILNPAYEQLSVDTGIPLIATADIHYPYPHQNEVQKVLHGGRNKSSVAITEAQWEYDILLTYPESDEEIIDDLIATGLAPQDAKNAVCNTSNLSERCNVELPKSRPLRVKTDDGRTAKEELQFQLKQGWKKRVQQRPDLAKHAKKYFARIRHEFSVIDSKDFNDYFLATADLVKWAKDQDIDVGPGRGSAAGSVICYILGITEIDPLHPTFQRMIFERFIDPNRTDMPDIDLDFDDERRLEIPARAVEVYGNENVCNVANHQVYRGKSALNTVAKSYGLPLGIFDPIAKRCEIRVETDERVDDVIADIVETYSASPDVAQVLYNFPDQIKLASWLEGSPNTLGRHAGGFVISSDPIPDVCPIYLVGEENESDEKSNDKRVQCIPYDKRDAEYLNMLKMDFLGLITMGQIGMIRRWIGMNLDDLYAMYYRDYEDGGIESEKIFQKFCDDDVMGIFQYEGGTTRQVVRDVQPTNFDELAACGALSRPGPLYGNQTEDYIAVKRGERDWKRIHPTGFDQHVEWTYGQIVYQEQIMWILRDLAGFSTERVLKVRKIIGKKLGEFQFAQLWDEFRTGCGDNGVCEEDAARVWSAITTAAGYAFNTAHAYSYALIAWWQMYFKIHKSPEFFASALAKNGDIKKNIPRRTALLKDAIEHDLKIGTVTPASEINWTPSPLKRNWILPGLVQIPKVSAATAEHIDQWRRNLCEPELWYVIDWDDMKPPVSKGGVFRLGEESIEKIKAFLAQDDPFGIFHTERQLATFRIQSENGEFEKHGLPAHSRFISSRFVPLSNDTAAFVGLARNIVERDEVELKRQRTGRPVDEIKAELEAECPNTKKATIFAYDEFGEMALRCSRFRYEELAERIGHIKEDHHVIVGWGRIFKDRPGSIQLQDLWVLEPD